MDGPSLNFTTYDPTSEVNQQPSSERNWLSRLFQSLTTRQRILFAVWWCVLTCVLMILVTYFIITGPPQQFKEISATQHVDPCQDFYKYTCQEKYNPRYSSTMNSDMTWRNLYLARQLIKSLIHTDSNSTVDESVATAFYTSCIIMNWTEVEPEPFVTMVKKELSPTIPWKVIPDDNSGWEWRFKKMMKISKENQTMDEESLSDFCSSLTIYIFPDVAANLFIENDRLSFNDNKRDQALGRLIQKIRNSMVSIVEMLQWIDEDSRLNITEEIRNLTIFSSASPDWESVEDSAIIENEYNNLTMDSGNFLQNWEEIVRHRNSTESPTPWGESYRALSKSVLIANAFYVAKTVHIWPGIVQRPTFDMGYPDFVNFARLGFTLGHEYSHFLRELIHAIFNETESNETFQKFEQCLVDQYNGFQVPLPSQFSIIKLFVNGSFTLNENFADILGIQIAFESLKQDDDIFHPISGYEGLTKEQIFFVAHAQERCESFSDDMEEFDRLKRQLEYDPHSPNSIRVLGALSNFPEFAKAFNCPVGSPYNPIKRCDFSEIDE